MDREADGLVAPISKSWQQISDLLDIGRRPWLAYLKSHEQPVHLSARDKLSREIQGFADFVTRQPREEQAAQRATSDLQAFIDTLEGIRMGGSGIPSQRPGLALVGH